MKGPPGNWIAHPAATGEAVPLMLKGEQPSAGTPVIAADAPVDGDTAAQGVLGQYGKEQPVTPTLRRD
jgi:hypothetical protein